MSKKQPRINLLSMRAIAAELKQSLHKKYQIDYLAEEQSAIESITISTHKPIACIVWGFNSPGILYLLKETETSYGRWTTQGYRLDMLQANAQNIQQILQSDEK